MADWSDWSNTVTVTCSTHIGDTAEAVNTKEDVETLNALMLGNKAYEEAHALRCAKLTKIIDLI